jgi:hypothetical protein
MRYLIIGEPCRDVIHKHTGETIHSYGGILYSIFALSVFCRNGDEIYPIMNIGEDEYSNVMNLLKPYKNINIEGISKVDFPTRKVFLDYGLMNNNQKDRFETSSHPTHPIEYSEIEKFLPGADGILINMISGIDISLDTLKKIRENFSGFMHIDIHNIVMRTNSDGTREHVNTREWLEWCTNTDTVQMNETEMSYLSAEKMKEYKIAEDILITSGKNIKAVMITRGLHGVSCYTKKAKSFGSESYIDLEKKDLTAIENPDFVDSTGCGDVFASGFFFEYSRTGDISKGLHFANRMASYNTSLEGIDELYKLIN